MMLKTTDDVLAALITVEKKDPAEARFLALHLMDSPRDMVREAANLFFMTADLRHLQ